MTGTAAYTASRDAGWRDRRGRWRCRDRRAKLPARASRWRPPSARGCENTLAVGLPERDQPRAGGNPVRHQRMQEGMHRRRKRNGMRGADEADRDGIDDRTAAGGNHSVEPVAGPGRARDLDEGAALRRGLELALARRHEGGRQFGNLAQAGRRRCADAARCACARNTRVAKAGAFAEHRGQPVAQRCGVGDVARLHRPFDAAGIGEGADRKRRRQPGHQPVQRRRLVRSHPAVRVGRRPAHLWS